MEIRFSKHADDELARRGLTYEQILKVLKDPGQVTPGNFGRLIYQSILIFPNGKHYIIRVVIERANDALIVVTLYKTSRLIKYWNQK